jgi:uncharacterized protein with PIN domain
MTKCEGCNKKIWKIRAVKVNVVDDEGKIVEHFYTCKKCGESYKLLAYYCEIFGEEYVFKMLNEIDEELKCENHA